MRRLETIHVVRTPEYVEFDYLLAGLMSRFLAWLLDGLLVGVLTGALILVVWLAGFMLPGLALAFTFVILFIANWGYFLLCEYLLAGQTVGKRALGLRTIQESGVRLGFYHAALRNLVRAVDNLPALYLAGGFVAAVSSKARRLGDLAAGTVVVRERRRAAPGRIAAPVEAMSWLGGDKRLEERVRRATIEEREVFLAAAMRREELSTPARLRLFPRLARYAAERFGIARPEHLSDEKFVVALAGLLLGGGSARAAARPGRAQAAGRAP